MANIIIKSEERKAAERKIRASFGAGNSFAEQELVEYVTAYTNRTISDLRKMEGKPK